VNECGNITRECLKQCRVMNLEKGHGKQKMGDETWFAIKVNKCGNITKEQGNKQKQKLQ